MGTRLAKSLRETFGCLKRGRYSVWSLCVFSFILVLLSRLFVFIFYLFYAKNTGDSRGFLEAFNIWDAVWYRDIAAQGYTSAAQYSGGLVNWAFFPLFSLLTAGFAEMTGLELYLAGFLLNMILQAAALVLVFRYVLETRGQNMIQAVFACILLSLGCYSFYFASFYTESLYLFLFTGALYFLYKKKYLLVGIFGAMLSATKNTGVVLLLGVVVSALVGYLQSAPGKKSIGGFLRVYFADWKRTACTALIPAGLLLFMLFLSQRAADPLAFLHAQSAWGGSVGNPLAVIWNGFASGEAKQVFFAVCALGGLGLCGFLFWQKRWTEATMALALLLIPLSVRLQSIPRYLAGNVLFTLALTDLILRTKKRWLVAATIAASVLAEFYLLFLWFAGSTFLW